MISRKFVLDFYNRIIDFQKKKYFSFFEITTALAFEYFHKSNVDIAVIETGLGGRLDSTNVITPILSIITSISLDHTNYLGDTIEKIAFEKAGIIKKNIPCVIGKLNRKAKKVIKKIAGEKKSSLLVTKIYPDLSGLQRSNGKNYPNINLSTILTALDYLNKSGKMKINDSGITRGLKKFKSNSGFFGRFEIFSKNPYTILDVSHNLEAIKNIENNLKSLVIRRSEPQLSNVKLSSTLVTTLQRSNEMKLYIIFAIMSDKDYKSSIKELEKLNAEIIYTKANINRSINPVILYQYTKNKNRAYIAQNIKKAYEFVLNKINKNDILLITGSFYLVSDFLKMKRIKTINDLIK
jgi:dihydrofolate synthase/folylpolyglutamate synthase